MWLLLVPVPMIAMARRVQWILGPVTVLLWATPLAILCALPWVYALSSNGGSLMVGFLAAGLLGIIASRSLGYELFFGLKTDGAALPSSSESREKKRGRLYLLLVGMPAVFSGAALSVALFVDWQEAGGIDWLHPLPLPLAALRLVLSAGGPLLSVFFVSRLDRTPGWLSAWMFAVAAVLAAHIALFYESHPGGTAFLALALIADLGGLAVLRTAAFRQAIREFFER